MAFGTSILKTIKKYIDAIQGGTKTIEDVVVNQETVLDLARNAQSASLLLTAAEQTMYEFVPTAASLFSAGYIDLTTLAADDIVIIKGYRKHKSGGAYVQFTVDADMTYTGVQVPAGKEILGNRPVMYGLKYTITQTQATTSYKTIDTEFFDASPGV